MASALARELEHLGALSTETQDAGVAAHVDLETAYRFCLWSRLGSRVLWLVDRFPFGTTDELYEQARTLRWAEHLSTRHSFALGVSLSGSTGRVHTQFALLRVKDAIVDSFRDRTGTRPEVNTQEPDVRLHLHLSDTHASVYIDLCGAALHQRGYRRSGGEAPLRENLAAFCLVWGGWLKLATMGAAFIDPMCGSGTLPIEAALIALDLAPGLLRERFAFEGWLGHQPSIWRQVLEEARQRAAQGAARKPLVFGSDKDAGAIAMAQTNARRAGLDGHIRWQTCRFEDAPAPEDGGLLVCNPPYGERLLSPAQVGPLHAQLGSVLRERFSRFRACVLLPEEFPSLGLWAKQSKLVRNGPLPCRLVEVGAPGTAPVDGAAFTNRLKKNLRRLLPWAKEQGVTCLRVYDADLPQFAVAIDCYGPWVHLQEYRAPDTVDPDTATERLALVLCETARVLAVPAENLFLKVRAQQKGPRQYEKQSETARTFVVNEGGLRFHVNLEDYLDTGLFLHHRKTRRLIFELSSGDLSSGKRFLNLFAYAGSATVYAAAGGARTTTSVDLSRTYLDWGWRNLEENGLAGPQHQFVQADCLDWIFNERGTYDLVLCDPPTFSNSKRMQAPFDVQADHEGLITDVMRLVAADGALLFSTSRHGFKLGDSVRGAHVVEDWTRKTTSRDFQDSGQRHCCYLIRHR